MPELKVDFQRFEDGISTTGNLDRLAFSIEPPIQVYDKEMIDKAAPKSKGGIARGYALSAPAEQVVLTHSDTERTYGTYETDHYRLNGQYPEKTQELKEYLKTSFNAALNPMGNVAITYTFLSDTSES